MRPVRRPTSATSRGATKLELSRLALAITSTLRSASEMTWDEHFHQLFSLCVERYQSGDKDFNCYYDCAGKALLDSIGYRPREFFDFVEDFVDEANPSRSTALLVASVRRDYFRVMMKGESRPPTLNYDNIPSFGEELEGLVYLPRLLAKAEAKLRGELDPELMFCCGGDRHFFRKHGGIHPADFLRRVWAADGDSAKLASWIRTLE